jgi:hypothetical protein
MRFVLLGMTDGHAFLRSRRFRRCAGSSLYLAPEVTPLRASLAGYGLEADIWSAGVCAFVLLCGEHPFTADSEDELLGRLAAAPALSLDARAWASVSPQGRDFVARLLRAAPGERPSAAAALRHAWLAPPAPQQRGAGVDEREEVGMIPDGGGDVGADGADVVLRHGSGWRGGVARVVPLSARQQPPAALPPAEDNSAAPATPTTPTASQPLLLTVVGHRISVGSGDAARALISAVRARFPRRAVRARAPAAPPEAEQQRRVGVVVVAEEAPAEDAAPPASPGGSERRWRCGCAVAAADAQEEEHG